MNKFHILLYLEVFSMNVREFLDNSNECMDLRVAIVNNCLAIEDKEDDVKFAKKVANYIDNDISFQGFLLYQFDMYCRDMLEAMKEDD